VRYDGDWIASLTPHLQPRDLDSSHLGPVILSVEFQFSRINESF
jgi:hypothetical protein